jgi:hypothetical protein
LLTHQFFKTLLLSGALSLIVSLCIYFQFSDRLAVAYLFGSLIALVNTGLFAYLWHLHFNKKDVAQFALVIVFKYAILVLIIYYSLVLGSFALEASGAGLVTTMIFISLVTAVKGLKDSERNVDGSPL